jgi:hypothetical protein
MTPENIYSERLEIEKHDRNLRTEALRAVTEQTKPLKAALYEKCEKTTGHSFQFDQYNYNNTYAWYKCCWCGLSRGQNEL